MSAPIHIIALEPDRNNSSHTGIHSALRSRRRAAEDVAQLVGPVAPPTQKLSQWGCRGAIVSRRTLRFPLSQQPSLLPYGLSPSHMPLRNTLPHWRDCNCQSLLVDNVHLLPDAQAADERLDLGVPRRDCSRYVVRPYEADCIIWRVSLRYRDTTATDTCGIATWPTRRLRAVDRNSLERLARWGEDVHHLRRKRLIVGHGHAVAGTDLVEALHA